MNKYYFGTCSFFLTKLIWSHSSFQVIILTKDIPQEFGVRRLVSTYS